MEAATITTRPAYYEKFTPRANSFRIKNHPLPLTVGTFANQQKLESEFFYELAGTYRDIFGHGEPVDAVGWKEYLKCPNCLEKASVEEVSGLNQYQYLPELENEQPYTDNFACPRCDTPMQLFYDQEKLAAEIQNYFREEIFSAFALDSSGSVQGFSYAWRSPLAKVWDEKFATFYQDDPTVSKAKFLGDTERNTHGRLTGDSEVLYYAEIGTTLPTRTYENAFGMSRAMLEQAKRTLAPDGGDVDLPVVLSAIPTANSYKIIAGSGGRPIFQIDSHPLRVLSQPFEEFLTSVSIPQREWQRRFRHNLKRVLGEIRQSRH